jgi:hypothetical protein
MLEAAYELGSPADGYPVRIRARGPAVLSNPILNRGTAFTPAERRRLNLEGLLPSGVSTLEGHEGLAQAALDDPVQQAHQAMWRPQYPSFEAI